MPKRAAVLTQRAIESKVIAAKREGSRAIELVDGASLGLRARVVPTTGDVFWSLSTKDSKGIRKRFQVGRGLSLADGRKAAERLRAQIREGIDPTLERRLARQRAAAARLGAGTFDALLTAYYENGPGKVQRSAADSLKRIRVVYARLLDKPALDLRRAELQLEAERWRTVSYADVVISRLRPVLKWAARRDLVAADCADLERQSRPGKRTRVLSEQELRSLWPHLDSHDRENDARRSSYEAAFQWLLYTGCCLREATGMTWAELTEDAWIIPEVRADGWKPKNGKSRIIPLTRQARALIIGRGLPDALVFPNREGMPLINWKFWTARVQRASGTAGWHRHDVRRTVATHLGQRLECPPHVISVILGHSRLATGVGSINDVISGRASTGPDATWIYALGRYEAEHLEYLQAWADRLDEIAGASVIEAA
jgi:integrase